MDIVHAFYQIDFESEYVIEKLIIKWKAKPPRIEILVHSKLGMWKTMLNEEPTGDIELDMVPFPALGVKILMYDLD
jgi:hypothetical protein